MNITTTTAKVYIVKGRYQTVRFLTEKAAWKRLAWEMIKEKHEDYDEMNPDWLAYLHYRFLRLYHPKAVQHRLQRIRADVPFYRPSSDPEYPF